MAKYPAVKIEREARRGIVFASEIENVDDFRELYSPLRITKENGLTRNLFRRDWRIECVAAGVNPALAYVMCMLADIQPEDVVCDPFCGGGTIAVSAAVYSQPKRVLASDISGTAVDKTIKNFHSAGIKQNKYAVFRSNVSQLKLQPGSVTKLITNLPYGVRVSDHEANIKTYTALADRMAKIIIPGGQLVILTQEKQLLLNSFARPEFKLLEQIDVDQGGLIPRIFVYKRNFAIA